MAESSQEPHPPFASLANALYLLHLHRDENSDLRYVTQDALSGYGQGSIRQRSQDERFAQSSINPVSFAGAPSLVKLVPVSRADQSSLLLEALGTKDFFARTPA